jgi:hypothetical protein
MTGRVFSVEVGRPSDIASKISMELRNQYVPGISAKQQSPRCTVAKIKIKLRAPRGLPPTQCLRKDRVLRTQPLSLQLGRHGFFRLILLFCVMALFVSPGLAQIPIPNAQPLPPGQDPNAGKQGSTIKVDVGLVVLHTTVLDDRGKFADGLKAENFRVFEDKVEQKLSTFKREDVPVSMGLVIDNSGSMRDKRPRVNEAALTLVEASNTQDEAFVVNFNDDFYLDLDKDFTSSIPQLKEALERIDSRGSTALFDAIIGSLDHLKKANKDKRVLLVVTDGEDNSSHNSPRKTLREIRRPIP